LALRAIPELIPASIKDTYALMWKSFPALSHLSSLHSSLYECSVLHHRLSPKVHQFRYRIFLLSLDLDELPSLHRKLWCFSYNRRNLYSFRDRDHLTLPGLETASIKENIIAWVRQQGLSVADDVPIRLITLPRVLGYIFNPVSFYYFHDSAGVAQSVVVQVGNTFREMKPYLIREPSSVDFFRLITPKHFYVSPFSELTLHFDFRIKVPGEHLEIHIDDRLGPNPEAERTLVSVLSGKQRALTAARLTWYLLKYPLITLKVIFFIHWHALLLWMKKIPFHRKSAHPELQRNVFKPHA
jgi:uncharacterized protein